MPGFMIRTFARPYVSGDSIDKGIEKTDSLWEESKISATLDLLGEAVTTREMVEYNIETYHELLDKLEGRSHASVSLKPTSLGVHESVEYCEESMRKILDKAKAVNIPITIDMEDHEYTDLTLDLYKTLLEDYPDLGTVLQSRLYRTEKDIEGLSSYTARIRICIGIYNEPEDIALQQKPEMKEKLVEYTQRLINDGHYVEVATHDKPTIDRVLQLADEHGWTSDQLEFQQLLGVPMRDKQEEILSKGYTDRLYVPFATDWKYAVPYLKRRLNNNPRMALYVMSHTIGKLFGRH